MHQAAADGGLELVALRQFAVQAPVPTLLLAGPDLRLLQVNAPFAAVVACRAAELHGRPAAEVFPRLAAAGHLAALDHTRRSGAAWRRRGLPLQFRSGEAPRFWDVEATPLQEDVLLLQLREATLREAVLRQGEAAWAVLAALGAGQAAQDTAPAAEDPRHRLLDALPHCVWQTDAEGRLVYANRRWRDCTGLSLEASRAGGWRGVLHPADRRRLALAWAAARDRGAEYELDIRLRHAGRGDWAWFRLCGAPVQEAGGEIRQWIGTCTDVEASHQAVLEAQQALAAERDRARAADHRIRNSLQLVAALLRLQSGRTEAGPARAALAAATARVQVVAGAHRALAQSEDGEGIALAGLLEELARAAGLDHAGALRVEVAPGLRLEAARAVPLALLLAELVTGRLGRQPEGAPPLSLRLTAADGRLRAELTGDAAGPAAPGGLGDAVLQAMARQLGARFSGPATGAAGAGLVVELPLESLARSDHASP